MSKIHNKIIWITGASSGIGEALVAQLSESNKLIISSRNLQELNRVKNSTSNSDNIKIVPLDLSEEESLGRSTLDAIEAFGKIDIVIHNAGISQRSLVIDTKLEVNREIMEVNYFGIVAITKELLPHLLDNGAGNIAIVSSLVGKFGSPYRSGYAASKHALHGYFDSFRAELYEKNIKVNLICPGFVKTNISVNALTKDGTPFGQMDNAQARGISADRCAQIIDKAIFKNRQEVYLGGKEKYAVYLKRFVPRLFSYILRKADVR